MARKLTDVERMNLDYLREALCQVLEPSQKNKAASVASALVRVRGDVVTDEDVSKRIVGKYGKERPGSARRCHSLRGARSRGGSGGRLHAARSVAGGGF
jgi:predicted transcriptional regulator